MDKSGSGQSRAIHEPTGEAWNANDVDGTVKAGPWKCVVPECQLTYTSHKVHHMRAGRNGAQPTQVSASFVVRGDARHDLAYRHERLPSNSKTSHVDDGSRRHIRRITELPSQDLTRIEATGDTTGATRSVYEYGANVHGLSGLLQFARACELDPALTLTERLRIGGNDYWWNALRFGPDRAAYRRATSQMQDQVHLDRTAYFVEGFARDVPSLAAGELWIHLRLITDFEGGKEQIRVTLPNTTKNWELVQNVRWKDPIALFAHRIHKFPDGNVALQLDDYRQLMTAASSAENMIAAPLFSSHSK